MTEEELVFQYGESHLTRSYGNDFLAILRNFNGYYECPKDSERKRLGPVVGYAGTYEPGKQYVGDVYFNFAKAVEQFPPICDYVAHRMFMKDEIQHLLLNATVLCGSEWGGVWLGHGLAGYARKKFVVAQKRIVTLATKTAREESKLVFDRHGMPAGARVVVVDDVLNNFSTTDQIVRLVDGAGSEVVGIVGFLNRSLTVENSYACKTVERHIPVAELVRKKVLEYRQDDPEVAEDVAEGNVVWKPKNGADWMRLKQIMEKAAKRSDSNSV